MNSDLEKKPMRERVLEAIKTGEVAMRPRWHFVLKTILLIVGGVIVVLGLVYVSSLILFVLRQSGVIFVPIFGFRGIGIFLKSLPWILIILVMIFVALLEMLVRRYAFAYRQPLLYSIAGILVVISIGAFIVGQTPLHGQVFRYAEDHHVPVMDPMYRRFIRQPIPDMNMGEITEFIPVGFIIVSPEEEVFTVQITPRTRLPLGAEFSKGDRVIIIGPRQGMIIDAFGVRKIDLNE